MHEPLGTILGTRAKVGILRVLTARGAPLSQRELARRAGVTLRSAQAALADLHALRVTTQLTGGRDHLTDLNPQHSLAPALIALFSAEAELARNVRTAIVTIAAGDQRPPLGLYLFGSVARAEETLDSDLDILLVARDASHRDVLLDRTLAGVNHLQSRYGVTLAPIAYTIREAKRGWGAGSAPWPELARDAVTIMGPPLGELLR